MARGNDVALRTTVHDEPGPRPLLRARAILARTAVYWAPVLVYVLLALTGVTNANIGVDYLREDPAHPDGFQLGGSQTIRSDEWGTESPIWLGEMTRGGADAATPLSVSNDFFAQLPDGPVSAVVFFEGTLLAAGQFIPEEMLFAAKWWLPSLLLFIGMPVWFRQITGRLRWGYLAAVLVFAAPANMWWSGRPVNSIGFAVAGCALAIFGAAALRDRRWLRGAIGVIGAGILLARTPTYYQPLAIVVAVPIVLATAAFLLTRGETWKQRLIGVGAVAVSGLVWTGLLFWENRDAVAAGLATAYPGDRKSTGQALDVGMVFGGTNLTGLEYLGSVNPSELVTAFSVLLLVVLMLFAIGTWAGSRPHAAATITVVVIASFWLLWATVNWGAFGAELPLANRVPNVRAAQGAGFVAIIAFCLFMAQWRTPTRRRASAAAGILAAFISAYAGSALQNGTLSGLPTEAIWLSSALVGLAVVAVVQWPHKGWPLVVAGFLACATSVTATPVLFGLGDLRTSDTAERFIDWGEQSRSDGTLWASEDWFVDALMTATGTPSLSYRQQIGPDDGAWGALDPDGQYEDMWNRGGLHIRFDWTDADDVTMTQPSPDTVIVAASPCTVAERIPELTHIVSSDPVTAECAVQSATFEWSGVDYRVYDLDVER